MSHNTDETTVTWTTLKILSYLLFGKKSTDSVQIIISRITFPFTVFSEDLLQWRFIDFILWWKHPLPPHCTWWVYLCGVESTPWLLIVPGEWSCLVMKAPPAFSLYLGSGFIPCWKHPLVSPCTWGVVFSRDESTPCHLHVPGEWFYPVMKAPSAFSLYLGSGFIPW